MTRRDILKKCIERDESLFGCEISDRHLKDGASKHRLGSMELLGPMNQDLAASMYKFVAAVRTGTPARQAFEEARFPGSEINPTLLPPQPSWPESQDQP
jgi:hypothetical protein